MNTSAPLHFAAYSPISDLLHYEMDADMLKQSVGNRGSILQIRNHRGTQWNDAQRPIIKN